MSKDLITYDSVNRKIETVPLAFDERDQSAVSWIWRPQIVAGKSIEPGTELADLQWDDDSTETMVAPVGCSGEIAWRNADFDYFNLRYVEQTVLTIAAAARRARPVAKKTKKKRKKGRPL